MSKRCGYVAVLGETNAGKSSLINSMVGQKVSIVSRKIQTTLARTIGIAVYGDSQIILIDTPGFLHKKGDNGNKGAESLAKIAWDAFRETDLVLFVVDVNKRNFDDSFALLKRIDAAKRVSLVMNKVDLIHKPKLLEMAAIFNQVRNFEQIFMVSSITGSGVEDILKYLAGVVPEGDWEYPEEDITDTPFDKYVAEITREHLYHRVHQEIPYKCLVETVHYEDCPDGSIKIMQHIKVKSEAHKVVCIGHGGAKIKAIGEAAREELQELLDRRVHLMLEVVVENPRH